MDRNRSNATERPYTPHKNQIQIRSFFPLYGHLILLSPLVATPRWFVNASNPPLYCPTVFPFPYPSCFSLLAFEYRTMTHTMAAVTRQLYTLVFVSIFLLTFTTTFLSSFFLCVPCKTPAHLVLHPDSAATASFPFLKISDFCQ